MKNKYSAKDIQVLKGLEAVRKKVGMYLGTRELQNFQCMKEIVENSIDIAVKGMNDYVCLKSIIKDKKQKIIVADCGCGIPVEKHKETKISTLTTIFTVLHAGSNFNKKVSSRGTFGVGSSAVNAVSEIFNVYTCRNNIWYSQKFSKGKPVTEVEKLKKFPKEFKDLYTKKHKPKGTIVEYVLDYDIMDKKILDDKFLLKYIKETSNLNSNITFRLINSINKEYEYCNKNGIIELLNKYKEDNKKVQFLGKEFVYEDKQGKLEIALQWSSNTDEVFYSYVNGASTINHGTHIQGMNDAIAKVFKKYTKAKQNISINDLRSGLVAFLHYHCNDDDYAGQNKEKLNTPSAVKIVSDTLIEPLEKWCNKNKKTVKEIINRALRIKQAKEEAQKITKLASNLKTNNKSVLVKDGKLVMSNKKCKVEDRRLFIVEGDSAGGSVIKARNPFTDEILKLRGKPLNVAKTKSIADDLKNREITNLLISLGADANTIKKGEKLETTRVGSVNILTDADVDGLNIQVLVLTILLKYAPKLIEKGMVYIINTPLFQASTREGNKYFGNSLEEVKKLALNNTKYKNNILVTRFKGLGEANSDMIYSFAFDENNVNKTKVTFDLVDKEIKKYYNVVGEDTTERKKLLGID